MRKLKSIGKREFIQHTSKYIKMVEESGREIIITHHNQPDLILSKIKPDSLQSLQGITSVIVHGDINDQTLSGI